MSKVDKLRVAEYLGHIADAIERIDRYVTDMSEFEFLEDEKTQDAVVRNLEIIGEACNNISKKYPDFAVKHAEIPWGFAYEMRMPWHTAITRSISRSFGRRFGAICRGSCCKSKRFGKFAPAQKTKTSHEPRTSPWRSAGTGPR